MISDATTNVKISLAEIFYYVFFSLLLFAKGIGLYDGQSLFKVFLILAMIAWVGKMWLTKYTIKEFCIVGGLLFLGMIVYLVSGEKGALLYIFMITGLKNVPIKRVFIVGATVWTVSFLGTACLNAVHLIEGPFKVHEKLGMGMIIRWGLGQSHPNVLHISFLVWVMFVVYLLGKKYDIKAAFVLMLGNIVMFLYSVSSTGVIAVTFYLGLSLYLKYRKNLCLFEKVLMQMVLPICIGYSLVAPLVLQGDLFAKINDITNTRLALAQRFLSENQITAFGIRLADITTSQLTMDNAFVFAYVTYGVVLFVLIVAAYVLLVNKYCRAQKTKELSITLTCFVAGIMEPFLFNTSFKNMSLLFMKELVFDESKEPVIALPGYIYKEYEFSFDRLYWTVMCLKNVIKNRRAVIFSAVAVGILIGSIGYLVLAKVPDRILVPEPECDVAVLIRTEESLDFVYLVSEDAAPSLNDKVVGFVDDKTKMIIYSGGIVMMERIRDLVCSGLTLGAILVIVAVIFPILRRKEVLE